MVRKMQETRQKMKFCSRNGIYKPCDISGAGCAIRTNSKIRLRGGRDHVWMSPSLHPGITNVASIHRKSYEKFYSPLKECIEDVGNTKKVQNKYGLNQPAKIGIRKIKQVHVPTKFKKVIIPKNNTKLSCPILKNMYIDSTVDSSSTLVMKRKANIKKLLGDSQKKKLQSKFVHELSNKRNTLNATTLKNISKFSILLLYLHFLCCYYLSFTKTQQFVELFETCTVEAV